MPLRVPCPSCQQLLEVPDATLGCEAVCPQCERVFTVTNPVEPALDVGRSPPAGTVEHPDAANPFAAPMTADPTNRWSVGGTGEIGNVAVDTRSILSYALEVWKKNLGIMAGMTLVLLMVQNLLLQVLPILLELVLWLFNAPQIASVVASVAVSLLALLIQWYLQTGMTMVMLKLLRGQRTEFAEMFGGGSRFVPMLGVMIPFSLLIFGGSLLFLVPGLMIWIYYWPCFYLVVEGRRGAQTMTLATRITAGNLLTGVLLSLLSAGLYFVGALACCVGVVFTGSLVSLMWTTAYLMMSNQLSNSLVDQAV